MANSSENLLHGSSFVPDFALRMIVGEAAQTARVEVDSHEYVPAAGFSRRAFSKSAASSSAVVPVAAIGSSISSPVWRTASISTLVGLLERREIRAINRRPACTKTSRVSPCRVTVNGVFDSRMLATLRAISGFQLRQQHSLQVIASIHDRRADALLVFSHLCLFVLQCGDRPRLASPTSRHVIGFGGEALETA